MNYIQKLKCNNIEYGDIIFKAIVGSHAHGTNIPESDIDIKGVYIQSPENVLLRGYQKQVDVDSDTTYYEIRRFIELCCTANPTALELLYSPEDCIKIKHPVFDILLQNRDKFVTKSCKYSFGGYAKSQITKASGLQKKMNWSKDKIERKDIIDFCYIIEGYNSTSLNTKFKVNEKYRNFAFAKNKNGKGIFALFFDYQSKFGFELLIKDTSTTLPHSKIPKEWSEWIDKNDVEVVWFNEDGFQRHCRKYKEYQDWLKNRNTQRYVDINEHGQQIDGKNMLHCTRLLEMSKEVAEGKGFNVRRPNAEYLISIRKGKVNLKELLDNAEALLEETDRLYDNSNLPDKCDRGFFMSLLVKIRQDYYGNIN